MHDPRLGIFFTRDPLEKQYAWNSPYAFSSNRVIDSIELEGLEARYTTTMRSDGSKVYNVVVDINVVDNSMNSSVYNVDIPALSQAIEQEMEFTYYGSDNNAFINFDVNMVVVDPNDPDRFIKSPNTNTLTLEFVDRVVNKENGKLRDPNTAGRAGDQNGNGIGNTQVNTLQVKIREDLQGVVRTATHELGHELGHVLGLRHPSGEIHKENGVDKEMGDKKSIISVPGNETNIMRQSQFGTGNWMSMQQLFKIIDEIDNDRPVKDANGDVIDYNGETNN